tara:strand:+ start:9235 stop:10203 length:969 start_codon:yes stop_codon:yes gene_type:complete
MIVTKKIALNSFLILLLFVIPLNSKILADNHDVFETIEIIKKDLKTLERAVYSGNSNLSDNNSNLKNNNLSEDALTRHLLKLSEIEKQFQDLTNKFEEINFKIDKLSNRLSKIQADNQLRFQDLENNTVSKNKKNKIKKELPGSDQPQDLGAISSYDTSNTSTTQQTQSIDTTSSIVTEKFEAEEKILPKGSPKEQYEFATSFLKVGDYNTAEVALREFVVSNPDHELAGSAQYWYAETFRIRQLFTDAATAYLEGYQKFPKSLKAPINLLKLGVSLVQIGEKDQGCSMISGVKKQYPKASQSVLQKAKYEEKKFGCPKSKS